MVWRPGEDFGDHDTAWARKFFAALGRFREGVYVNFLGDDEDPDRVREAYRDFVYDRLAEANTDTTPTTLRPQPEHPPTLRNGAGGFQRRRGLSALRAG